MSTNESYTIEEISQILKVSKLTIYDLIKKGELQAYRVGRQMRVDSEDLELYKKSTKKLSNNQIANQDFLIPKVSISNSTIRSIIISGQDNSLDILAKYIEEKRKNYRALRSYTGSLNGLMNMYCGQADIVSTHLFDGDSMQYNIPYIRKILVSNSFIVLNLICRQAGFYVQEGNPKNIKDWVDLIRYDVKIINREIGSGARILLDEQLRIQNINKLKINGYESGATSHFGVAAMVAKGEVDVGVGIARITNLAKIDFIPLIKERYDLVILKNKQNLELIEQIKEILQTTELKEELLAIGYDISQTGNIVFEQ